jgi:hypothetical protein
MSRLRDAAITDRRIWPSQAAQRQTPFALHL